MPPPEVPKTSLIDMAALAEKGIELAQQVGKWGIPGVVVYMGASVIHLIRRPTWESAESLCTAWGVGLVLIAILAAVRRGNQITVTAAMEAKADRTAIAETLGAPAPMPSQDKALRREEEKQIAARTVDGIRLTNPDGVQVPKE